MNLFSIVHRYGDHLRGRSDSGQNLPDPIFSQGPHPEFPGSPPELGRAEVFINKVADLVIYLEDFKNTLTTSVASLPATVALGGPHDGALRHLGLIQPEEAHFRLG